MKRYKATYRYFNSEKTFSDLLLANNIEEAKEKAIKKDNILNRLIEIIEW